MTFWIDKKQEFINKSCQTTCEWKLFSANIVSQLKQSCFLWRLLNKLEFLDEKIPDSGSSTKVTLRGNSSI